MEGPQNSYRELRTFQWTYLRCSMSSWVVKFLWGQGICKEVPHSFLRVPEWRVIIILNSVISLGRA
jgi:hypothetical protein